MNPTRLTAVWPSRSAVGFVQRAVGVCMVASATLLAGCEQRGAAPGGAAGSSDDEAPTARRIVDFDYEADWRCLTCDHRVAAPGGTGPRSCPNCKARTLWVSLDFDTESGATVPVAYQYNEEGDHTHLRIGAGPWQPAYDASGNVTPLVCPRTGERLFIRGPRRTAFSFRVTWICSECEHQERAAAAVGPRKCPECAADSFWATVRFQCRTHGPIQVRYQYTADGQIDRVALPGGDWVQDFDRTTGQSNLRCPECGETLAPRDRVEIADEP
ncbi:MAG: hypothetical protein IPM18_00600 [Phycisphaerales bacterium]|nr:hypothetical protein [Phycisphaerales bacterium]